MKFRIHFDHKDGGEDSVVVEGETIEDVRRKAHEAVSLRGGGKAWSEEINEGGSAP